MTFAYTELIQLCLPHYHIKAGETVQQGRPYTRLETMVRVHSLSICPIRRWSHIWRATWWLATSAACLALVFSSQIRRYCASWKKELSISENFGGELGKALVECVNVRRHLEHAKASARCSIEWSFLWLKRIYGYAKVRYRGLANNHSRAVTMVRSAKVALLITPETLVRASFRVP